MNSRNQSLSKKRKGALLFLLVSIGYLIFAFLKFPLENVQDFKQYFPFLLLEPPLYLFSVFLILFFIKEILCSNPIREVRGHKVNLYTIIWWAFLIIAFALPFFLIKNIPLYLIFCVVPSLALAFLVIKLPTLSATISTFTLFSTLAMIAGLLIGSIFKSIPIFDTIYNFFFGNNKYGFLYSIILATFIIYLAIGYKSNRWWLKNIMVSEDLAEKYSRKNFRTEIQILNILSFICFNMSGALYSDDSEIYKSVNVINNALLTIIAIIAITLKDWKALITPEMPSDEN